MISNAVFVEQMFDERPYIQERKPWVILFKAAAEELMNYPEYYDSKNLFDCPKSWHLYEKLEEQARKYSIGTEGNMGILNCRAVVRHAYGRPASCTRQRLDRLHNAMHLFMMMLTLDEIENGTWGIPQDEDQEEA